jgi:hypothetical protein
LNIDDINFNKEILLKNNDEIINMKTFSENIPINIPCCIFCGSGSYDDKNPLFTTNNKNFICKNCTKLALITFLKNGEEFNISELIKK